MFTVFEKVHFVKSYNFHDYFVLIMIFFMIVLAHDAKTLKS